jgi:hypothetical protein
MGSTILKISTALICFSVVLNIFDIALHLATNQAEVLRISGNIFVIVGSGITLYRRSLKSALIPGLVFYLILNGIFIAFNGIGRMGVVFIFLTIILGILSIWLQNVGQHRLEKSL